MVSEGPEGWRGCLNQHRNFLAEVNCSQGKRSRVRRETLCVKSNASL